MNNNNTEYTGIHEVLLHIADQASEYHSKATSEDEKAFLLGIYHLAVQLEQGIKESINKRKGSLTISYNYKAAKTAYNIAIQKSTTLQHILEMLVEMELKNKNTSIKNNRKKNKK